MKIKLWQFEYDFDRDDAKIIVPIILLVIAVWTTNLNPILLIGLVVAYYLLYFFMSDAIAGIKGHMARLKMRCPKCKNRKIILQGYQGYKSDEEYPYYYCDDCGTTSILTNGGLLKI
jgi:ribosomal protein S27E